MRGQMSVVFNTLGGDGTRRDGESNRYPVELPGGIRGFRRRLPGVRRNRLPSNTRPDATQLNAHGCSN